jgi:tRNA-dihydrouridine synthase B
MKPEIRQFINTPLEIGGKTIPTRLILAPMSGLTHVAFREMVDHYGGCGLLFTEMCSARSVPQENPLISPVFRWREEELPYLVCQLFGSDPDIMATAAKRVEQEGFFGVDLNFGCSVAAICKKNCGAALLKTPDHAVEIVREVRKAVSIPVTVKYRTGWKDCPKSAVELAGRFEEAGADALTFHPRVAPDRRSRPPRWEYIAQVKQAVSIPVFGNGEVFTADDCEKIFETTGCDGIALGRIAIAKPWIFARWADGFIPDQQIWQTGTKQIISLLTKHYDMTTAIRKFKKMAVYNAALFKYGHSFFKKMARATDFNEIEKTVDAFFDTSPELTLRPNLNLFS